MPGDDQAAAGARRTSPTREPVHSVERVIALLGALGRVGHRQDRSLRSGADGVRDRQDHARALHALGKAMLAFLPADDVARVLDTWGLPRVIGELAGIRARGVSVSDPTRSVTVDRVRRVLGLQVARTAEQISQALGWTGTPQGEGGER